MSTLFSWLPNVLGLKSEPNEFRDQCYKTYGGDAPRWGGWMDSCAVGSGAYAWAYCFAGFVGTLASVVGGYMALEFAKNAHLEEVPSDTNSENYTYS